MENETSSLSNHSNYFSLVRSTLKNFSHERMARAKKRVETKDAVDYPFLIMIVMMR
jgi:hypothetical protein